MPHAMDWKHYLRKWSKVYYIRPGEDNHKIYLGSGKITRRIRVIKERVVRRSFKNSDKALQNARKRKMEERLNKTRGTKSKFTGPVQWPSIEHKEIFIHWNRKGKGFTKHSLNKNSKTIVRGNKQITEALKKHDKELIMYLIDRMHTLIENPYFKAYKFYHGASYAGNKLTLANFFNYPPDKIEWHKKGFASRFRLPNSWFNEVLENNNNLEEKWTIQVKSIYPTGVKILKKTWEKYKNVSISDSDLKAKSIFTIWCNRICNFARINKIDYQLLVDVIIPDEILNIKSIEIKQLNFVLADNFYTEKIPDALRKRDPSRYRDVTFNTNIEEIKKS
jgi:hypothetical protein